MQKNQQRRNIMDDQMVTKINNHMAFLLDTKNKILMFAFATTLAMFGAALKIESSSQDIYIYTLPFFLLLPFTARITYYRIWCCHQQTFLKIFAQDRFVFKDNEKEVPIERHFLDKIIAFLVNFEMGFLAIACLIIYIVKSWEHYTNSIGHFLAFSFSIIATILICSFCISALNYSKMSSYYLEKWKEKKDILQQTKMQNNTTDKNCQTDK